MRPVSGSRLVLVMFFVVRALPLERPESSPAGRCRLCRRPVASLRLVEAPATHVVRRSDNTRADAFGPPRLDHEVADTGGDARPGRSLRSQLLGIFGVDPQRVAVTDLVQPLRVGGTGVNQGRDAERRQAEMRFGCRARCPGLPMHMARDPLRRRVLGPAPLFKVVENSSSFFDGVGKPSLIRRRLDSG